MTTQTISHSGHGLSGWFHNVIEGARARIERQRNYRLTLTELNRLSDRELADLNIHRSMIQQLAWDASEPK